MAKKLKTFTVMGKIKLEADIEIEAETLEAAVSKARALNLNDFVDIPNGYNDGELKVYGVFQTHNEE